MENTTIQKCLLIVQCTVCDHITRAVSYDGEFKPGYTVDDFSCSAKTCDNDDGCVVDIIESPALHCGICGIRINVLIDNFMQNKSTGKVKCTTCGLKRRSARRK